MLQNEIVKLVEILQSAGNEVSSFAETSSETYAEIIEFKVWFDEKSPTENTVKIAKDFAVIGYEILLLDRTSYPKAVIQIIPTGSRPMSYAI